ncbi:MAG TPA: RlmE family RNA methyltransferase [Candidatus Syntrophoarchaeum butanivorans]|uniref:Ribosomal RNA large subunit methyltransferase E n=1 Tax=Candidatus Syntropharchaeum butanivorans TaxID=1839936 RepID=A0A1F2P3C8_9EURY|nr:MAG: Ribosomal RNA methyltransferase J [Candidatus Syntrophoarchaeum butanivorans]RJS70586.1 MAG: RlmE family RNA methyltransferase [Candidatus Syntrophoarchaeum sp. WYZ-LMO15]HEC56310.1 RlmE family RNA methyltransferase [Candidatus Syntrophoarchaeum butanivorans]
MRRGKRRRDHFWREAKRWGYRSRASFKLIQINERFGVIREGYKVLDLGASPGGWLQVAKEIVGDRGTVIGVDILPIDPIEGVFTLKMDMRRPELVDRIMELTGGEKLDTVLSDASPNLSGNWSLDHARSIDLARTALRVSENLLKRGGNFVVKVFQGDMYNEFFEEVSDRFRFTKAYTPRASRKESAEIYVVGKELQI